MGKKSKGPEAGRAAEGQKGKKAPKTPKARKVRAPLVARATNLVAVLFALSLAAEKAVAHAAGS